MGSFLPLCLAHIFSSLLVRLPKITPCPVHCPKASLSQYASSFLPSLSLHSTLEHGLDSPAVRQARGNQTRKEEDRGQRRYRLNCGRSAGSAHLLHATQAGRGMDPLIPPPCLSFISLRGESSSRAVSFVLLSYTSSLSLSSILLSLLLVDKSGTQSFRKEEERTAAPAPAPAPDRNQRGEAESSRPLSHFLPLPYSSSPPTTITLSGRESSTSSLRQQQQ